MNDINNPCPSHESLVTYLYDECEPAERTSIAAHVSICTLCTDEIHALSDTRAHLASWSPPALPLGFQLTRTEAEQPSNVLQSTRFTSRSSRSVRRVSEGWWRQPLPAWAQAAAAVVIFAAGMSAGALRSGSNGPDASLTRAVTVPVATTVSRDDLARFDARLRSIENAQAQPPLQRTRAGAIDERELLARVTAMVDARLVQSNTQNISLLADAGRTLTTTREELAARMDTIDAQQNELQQALGRGYVSFQRASLTGR